MHLLKKKRKSIRDGYHHNSSYWKNHFKKIPTPEPYLRQILVGMILGDAYLSKQRISAHIKFEQGYNQKEFVYHLFALFKEYCFAEQVSERLFFKGVNKGKIKSYWFRTASHQYFTKLHTLFYKNKVKCVNISFLRTILTPRLLAYWIMCDGSLQKNKKTCVLHTQGFTKEENQGCSQLLNTQFGLSSKVILHKKIYWVIEIPSKDSNKLAELIDPYLIPSMYYKSPNLSKQLMT